MRICSQLSTRSCSTTIVRKFLATIGLDYNTLTKEELVSLIGILKKSKYMKNPISAGKHDRRCSTGKAKRNANKEKPLYSM